MFRNDRALSALGPIADINRASTPAALLTDRRVLSHWPRGEPRAVSHLSGSGTRTPSAISARATTAVGARPRPTLADLGFKPAWPPDSATFAGQNGALSVGQRCAGTVLTQTECFAQASMIAA